MGIYENIDLGKYEPTLPYPTRPQRPAAAKGKTLHGLSADDIQARRDYEVVLETYQSQQQAWREQQQRLLEVFWQDVYAEHKIDPTLPIVSLLRQLAWETGHSNGLHEVYTHWDHDMVPLYRAAVAMMGTFSQETSPATTK